MTSTSTFEARFTRYSRKTAERMNSGPMRISAVNFGDAYRIAQAALDGMRSIAPDEEIEISKIEHLGLGGTQCTDAYSIWTRPGSEAAE